MKITVMLVIAMWLIVPVSAQVHVGDPAPDFTLPDTAGNNTSLNDFSGDIVLLNFFATWCVPCQIEAPQLQDSIWNVFRNQGVTVLGVDFREPVMPLRNFIAQFHLTYPIVRDTAGAVANLYGMSILPTSFIIDRNGRIAWIEEGFDIPRFIRIIDSLLSTTQIYSPGEQKQVPAELILLPAYPNPFNSRTTIRFRLAKAGHLLLRIYAITGQQMFEQGVNLSAGTHALPLNFAEYASGIYFYSLNTKTETKIGKLILQK